MTGRQDDSDNDDPDKFEDDISDNRIGREAEWRKKQVILIVGEKGSDKKFFFISVLEKEDLTRIFFYHFCFGALYVMRSYNRSLFA